MMTAKQTAETEKLSLSYPEVGCSLGAHPHGYRTLTANRLLRKRGSQAFDDVTDALFRWQVQARAGFRVEASSLIIVPDTVVLLNFGFRPLLIGAPCKVLSVIDEPNRRGFTYGTLEGHPVSGEEAFVLRLLDDGTILFQIVAFSRPVKRLARLVGPVGAGAQRLVVRRYLRSLDILN